MAPEPTQQHSYRRQSSPPSATTNTSSHHQQSLLTQEEAQVCTRLMTTLLECRLQEALAAESASLPKQQIYTEQERNSEFVTCHDRDGIVRWLCVLTHDSHYCLEVFFRAANILDSFLSQMKVRPKFLQCVAVTCFFIASKLEEKPENVETVLSDVVQNYNCQFSPHDIQRMELIIMQKLDFKLTNHTPYDFLKIFHIVGITNGSLSLPAGLSPDQHLCHTALCMEETVCNHTFMNFRPSLLALAVLGCDLKLLRCDWLTAVVTLQKLADVRGGELSVCYEAVAPFYNAVARRHPLYIASPAPVVVPPSSAQPQPPLPSSLPADKENTPPHTAAAATTVTKEDAGLYASGECVDGGGGGGGREAVSSSAEHERISRSVKNETL